MLLENKVCIVTGAGKGFGRDIARTFYNQGAKLALITRSQADVDDMVAEFNDKKSRILYFCGDVSNKKDVNNFISKAANNFGTFDILVNNAGMRFRKEFLDINSDELDLLLSVNLKSVFFTFLDCLES